MVYNQRLQFLIVWYLQAANSLNILSLPKNNQVFIRSPKASVSWFHHMYEAITYPKLTKNHNHMTN